MADCTIDSEKSIREGGSDCVLIGTGYALFFVLNLALNPEYRLYG
jgi:hypothetical protein